MLSFESDYTEGAHPAILEKFIETKDKKCLTTEIKNDIIFLNKIPMRE